MTIKENEQNMYLISCLLEGDKFEGFRWFNEKDGITLATEVLPDDIQYDIQYAIQMPVMEGFTAKKLIRESKPGITIIAQTAYSDDLAKILEFGFSSFIFNPFTKQQLLSFIKIFL